MMAPDIGKLLEKVMVIVLHGAKEWAFGHCKSKEKLPLCSCPSLCYV